MLKNSNLQVSDPLEEKTLPRFCLEVSLNHHSPTQFAINDGAWCYKYLVLTQEQRRTLLLGNSQMTAGVFVNNVLQNYYADKIWIFGPDKKLTPVDNPNKGVAKEDLIKEQLQKFKDYIPTDEKDNEKKQKYLEEVLAVTNNGFSALERIGAANKTIYCEEQISVMQDKSQLFCPITGRVDFRLNDGSNSFCLIELKTSWSRLGKVKKNGERSFYLSTLPAAPSFNHLIQTAFYSAYYDYKIPTKLLYVNQEGYKIFDKDNCYDLTEEGQKKLFRIMCKTFARREKLLSLFDGKPRSEIIEGFISLVPAEFDHPWAWLSLPPENLQHAKELWQVN